MVRLNAVRKFSEATAILIAEQVCVCDRTTKYSFPSISCLGLNI